MLLLCFALPSCTTINQIENNSGQVPSGYKLVWRDEFSGAAPDLSKWSYDTSRNLDGWYNDERQYYSANRAKNTRIENGILILEAHKEDLNKTDFPDWGGQKYTSGKLISAGKFDFTYGYVEVRAKLPCQIGSWPAIWTLYSDPNADWPDGGEIDILEHTGATPGLIQASTHTLKLNHIKGTQNTAYKTIPHACDSFHNYHLEWTKDYIKQGVDGQNYMSHLNSEPNDFGKWPFDTPQYIILNLAVGGMYVGAKGIDDNSFPWQFQIDYVRVYKK